MVTTTPTTPLAKPFRLPCGVTVPNRIIKAAMTECMAHPSAHLPVPQHYELYKRWAQGGAGMLISGNVMIDKNHKEAPRNVSSEGGKGEEELVKALSEWMKKVREGRGEGGSLMVMQISHPGRQSPMSVTSKPLAPSAVPLPKPFPGLLFHKPTELTLDQIEAIIEKYASCAERAKKGGWDGVQIHAAHGYLLSQFLSPRINHRGDKWGVGERGEKGRMLQAVVRRVRERVGGGFVVGVKLNSADFGKGGFGGGDVEEVVGMLEREGIDFLEISGGTYEFTAFFGPDEQKKMAKSTLEREAYFIEFATTIRKTTSIPLLLTGGFRSKKAMEEALDGDVVDFVGVARPFCIYPSFPKEFIEGTRDTVLVPTINAGLKFLSNGLENLWYQQQMDRISLSLPPSSTVSLSAFLSLPSHAVRTYVCDWRGMGKGEMAVVVAVVVVLVALLLFLF